MMLTASWLFADAVVDKTFEDNQNEFEFYWYYYDDNAGVGPNDRPQIAPTLTPSVIDVPYTEKERHAFDDPADTWMVKEYKFQPGESLSKKCATMPFTFGDMWEAGYCTAGACAQPFVGLGTMLTKEGSGIDLTGADTIHFFAKSRVNELTEVYVKIQTLDIDEYADKPGDQMKGDEFGYYGTTIAIGPGDWQEFNIAIADLDLPGSWAYDFAFNITKCTKLGWEIKGDGEMTSDTIDVADVYFKGSYTFVSPSMWPNEEAGMPTSGLFSSFDKAPFNQSGLGTFWYAYNDVEIGGSSSVDETYAVQDPTTGKLAIKFTENSGFGNAGQGAALVYTLGPPIPRDTITILGFVGIGCNLYDSAKATYFNADSAGISSVYFEYFTDAGAKFMTLEVSDVNDVGDALNPTRKESRGSGIVYYRNFPATNGVWKRVLIPLDSLVTHDTWNGYVHIPLDKMQLAKIQWKVQAGEGTNGAYAIDNIHFPGADFGLGQIAVEKEFVHNNVQSGFNASFANNAIRVDWNGTSKLANGKIMLINTRGMVVSSTSINGGSNIATGISAATLPTGMYFVRLNAIDAAGKAVVMQAPVTIVK
ncbi:MAG: T9SS type A sorting domain-containing protein [Chitinispirillaceae bacterium]|nr:T9SS type A sorting domain-containing protein [Chitinispirillaceae bacterium]